MLESDLISTGSRPRTRAPGGVGRPFALKGGTVHG